MNKGTWILLLILVFLAGVGAMAFLSGQISVPRLGPAKEEVATVGGEVEVTPIPTPTPMPSPALTRYTNGEFGFSLSYPADWGIPVEGWIEPPSQHLHQVVLNPDTEEQYLVDIYDQPSPISLDSFVRNYFRDIEAGVSWTNEIKINGQEALQFFIPKAGAMPMGIGAVAFRKGSYILTISTSVKRVPGGDLKQLINEETLTQIAESFSWLE